MTRTPTYINTNEASFSGTFICHLNRTRSRPAHSVQWWFSAQGSALLIGKSEVQTPAPPHLTPGPCEHLTPECLYVIADPYLFCS